MESFPTTPHFEEKENRSSEEADLEQIVKDHGRIREILQQKGLVAPNATDIGEVDYSKKEGVVTSIVLEGKEVPLSKEDYTSQEWETLKKLGEVIDTD